nr:hypothetical protein [Tanacetum cinerariifolium]
MAAFNVLEKQFQMFITSRVYLNDEYVAMTRNYFIQYTQQAIPEFRDTLIQHLESVKNSINERAQLKRDRTESKEQDTSSRLGNDAHDDGADIRPIYDEEPMAKVQTTPEINVFAIGKHHTEKPEFNNEGEGFKEFSSDIQAMASDHNSSKLRIHNHSNEPFSSKLVPKVVPLADSYITKRVRITIPPSHNNAEGRMPTKIELTLEQSQQGVSNDVMELALMCGRMFSKESDKVEKYVGGISNMIQGDNNTQQPPFKRQNVARAYSTSPSEKEYAGTLPLCNKCNFHRNGLCTVKCANCNRVGVTRDCRSSAATNNHRTLTCNECANQLHYRSDCPELKNQNHGNQTRGTEARRMVYALGGGETDQDPNNMENGINA